MESKPKHFRSLATRDFTFTVAFDDEHFPGATFS